MPGVAGPQLVIPCTLDANDMRFETAQGFDSGCGFEGRLVDAFDVLYEEGAEALPATPTGVRVLRLCETRTL